MDKLKVGVIFGGRSGEYEVSLMSARSVLSALDPAKYRITQIGITQDGAWLVGEDVLQAFESRSTYALSELSSASILPDLAHRGLYSITPVRLDNLNSVQEKLQHLTELDVVIPVLHGTFGEDGTLQGLLELAELAYVGAGVLGSALGMDKGVFKDVMRANEIPVVESITILRSEIRDHIDQVLVNAEALAPYPLFTKPANLGSSVGISKCNNRADLVEGLMEASQYDRRVLIERGLEAREIEVSVLGNNKPRASIPGEILPSREFYSYEAKYIDGTSGLLIPAPIPEAVAQRVQDLAIRAYRAIDCAGMARVDFLLEKENPSGLYLNEINTIPGFTEISMYPKLWEASGLSYSELVDNLIELALERKAEREQTIRYYRERD